MAEGIEKPAEAAEQGTAAEDVTKEEPTATDGDVLEEDDDFEEFEHEGKSGSPVFASLFRTLFCLLHAQILTLFIRLCRVG